MAGIVIATCLLFALGTCCACYFSPRRRLVRLQIQNAASHEALIDPAGPGELAPRPAGV